MSGVLGDGSGELARKAKGQRPKAKGQRPKAKGQRPKAKGQRPKAKGVKKALRLAPVLIFASVHRVIGSALTFNL
ncbi:MAG: hypothetical protein IT491_05920 [Gammaproteobacteria bacterium]|jgi:hypothetical protein|nr:hypothetical protein [Gammaproteobacteria bacterium]